MPRGRLWLSFLQLVVLALPGAVAPGEGATLAPTEAAPEQRPGAAPTLISSDEIDAAGATFCALLEQFSWFSFPHIFVRFGLIFG